MRLQSIVFPSSVKTSVKELYVVSNEDVRIMEYNKAQIIKGGVLDAGTYFNSISIKKWKEYTTVNNIKFSGKIKGHYILEIFERIVLKNTVYDQCIYSSEQNYPDETSISVILLPKHQDSMCFVKIRAISDVFLEDLHYSGDEAPVDDVRIAVAICTYKREDYIQTNIEQIRKRILQNNKSLLHSRLDIIVIDNGQTLNFDFKDIQLYPNRNTGGTGGFTRGLIEALQQREEKSYTHVLLMDDDVDIEPEAFERTYSMLCLLKHTYKHSFIGGAMLRRDQPYIQEESGANWDGISRSHGKGYDLRNAECIMKNDEIYSADYNGWWYSCIPLSEIGLNNLPFPFFIHCDDVEYGLRNAKNWIFLNGICVWHEIPSVRKNLIRDYYDVRNFMVMNILYDKKGYSKWALTAALICRLAAGVLIPKLSFHTRINAMKDFFEGVEWWEGLEIDDFHQKVSSEKVNASIKDIIIVCLRVIFFPLFYDKYYDNYQKHWKELTSVKYWNKYRSLLPRP